MTVSQGLDEETFQTLKTALVNHPRLQNADSEALGASFAGSSGFVVRFDGWGGVDATAKKLLGAVGDTSFVPSSGGAQIKSALVRAERARG